MTNKNDGLLLAHLTDLAKSAERKGQPAFSDFTDPVRAERFKNRFRTGVTAWGGYENAERKMLGFFPEGNEGTGDFPIDTLRITFNARFNSPPSHRDYLGSLLGLGIEREKTGDIKLISGEKISEGEKSNGGALVYVSSDISDYIVSSLERVGNTSVKAVLLEPLAADSVVELNGGREARITVASLRLDAVVAAAFRISRGKAAALITGEKVFINWTLAAQGSKNIQSGDIVTVRGLGRIQLDDASGKTKKDRVVIKCTLN